MDTNPGKKMDVTFTDMDDLGAVTPIVPTKLPDDIMQLSPARKACPKCRGTGKWVGGYVNFTERDCFTCEGTGQVAANYKPRVKKVYTSAELAKKHEAAIAKQKRDQEDRDLNWKAFEEVHGHEAIWIKSKLVSFDFALSMMEAVCKHGDLTPGQLAAVQKCMRRDEEKIAAVAKKQENAPQVAVQKIEAAFNHARSRDIKRPRMNLGAFKFAAAPMTGKNPGAIYVTEAELYLGKISGGKFLSAYDCSEAKQAEVVAVCEDPLASAIAYGRRTGNCSCCGRELTNHASIDAGIGPICAEKYNL